MGYPVNEVFETVQGEASFTGTPSVFVRLQGCPVGCPWCDTKHTWEHRPNDRVALDAVQSKAIDSALWAEVEPNELVALVLGYRAHHVVITGGEPCLYDLVPLTQALLAVDRSVQVETSGTQPIRVAPATWVTLSAKLDMPGGLAVRHDALARANEVKHPIGKAADYEALAVRVLPRITPGTLVWLQPLSQSEAATRLCVALATLHRHRVSVQVHKYLGLR